GEFCTYMLQQYKGQEETARRNNQVAFILPATMNSFNHGIPIVNIQSTHDDTIVTVREDGCACHWSPELKPQKTKHLFNEDPTNTKSKWASDFALMSEYNKLMIATELQLYNLFSLEPYCQISELETIPLTVDYRLWNKLPKTETIPNISINHAVLSPNLTFIRWKVHHDWVTQIKYFHSLQVVVSSSNEESSSLVICLLPLTDAEQQLSEIKETCYEGKSKKIQLSWTPQVRASCDQTVFSIYKGVRTFDLCQKHRLLITGGMDKLIRLWNPHYSKPTGILKGHSAPIISIRISSEDNQIFSVSTDCTVKIWHLQDQCCLFTADPKASRIHGDISACAYSPAMKSLYIAADCMTMLPLKLQRLHRHFTVSHNEPVLCCGYSKEFRQVVSCTEGSVVRIWDFDTGCQLFEFGGSHELSSITCLTFDPKGRLVTGGRDGSLKIWNFNNGLCLKTLKKGECREVCDCIFLQVHRNYVMSVGRDRKIDIYPRPQASWQDDLKNGHKDDILCMAQCPPSFVATGSSDGEIIVWNVDSGRIQTSVPSIVFLKDSYLKELSSTTALLSSGAECVNLWNVLGRGKFVSSFKASKFQQKITKLAKAEKDVLLYMADRIGYIYVYSMEKLDPEKKSLRETFWRAHTNTVTLHVVDNDQVVLTSSTDYTVRLWSTQGEFI
uniref:WD40 repeat domain 95 n=1 Tax=Haplochromis burtoni TaxID=8153 RepID=A0A3Q2UUN8_HAPBU